MNLSPAGDSPATTDTVLGVPELTPELFHAAVEAATLAPSMHNVQPWRFRLAAGALEVRADPSRQLPVSDPRGWALRIACGAAVANAGLALAAAGVQVQVRLTPEPGHPYLMARLTPMALRQPTPYESQLAGAIPHRHSNRRPFADEPVPGDARAAMLAAAVANGAWLELLVGSRPLELVAEIIRAADRILVQDPDYLAEQREWARHKPGPGSGIPAHAVGVAPSAYDLLAMRDFGGPPRGTVVEFEAEPLVGILGTAGDSGYDHLVAGVAMQHVLLTATAHGLAVSMLSQAIEVPAARAQLRRGLGRRGDPQMILRIGFGQPVFATPRRPVNDVIDD